MNRFLAGGVSLTALGTCMLYASPVFSQDSVEEIIARMTLEERVGVLSSQISFPGADIPGVPEGSPPAIGFNPGVPRVGFPSIRKTDGPLGVSSTAGILPVNGTAFPATLGLAASFNRDLSRRVGALIGSEARGQGYNVLLAGGANLTRDPRGGRNFEYMGEDGLLAGEMVGNFTAGVQSQGVVSTVKHFAVNDQETLRQTLNARIDWDEARESDLFAFQKGIEIGGAGAVMCSYNRLNGAEACGNNTLLDGILKEDWGYQGWVMSDWGAVEATSDIEAGLDQQSGWIVDGVHYFGEPLLEAVRRGDIAEAEVNDAATRILRSLKDAGADFPFEESEGSTIDYVANGDVSLEAAQNAMVLLKNDGALPLAAEAERIVVIGGNADQGVLAGGGSSLVIPQPGIEGQIEIEGQDENGETISRTYYTDSPVAALRAARPDAEIVFVDGDDPGAAAAASAEADMAIVFATKWQGEGFEDTGIGLGGGQDDLISGVAEANGNTVVVLETGNPVAMPWLGGVRGVVQAWYPGQEGGQAIADVLTGAVNPSGRLPMTFLANLDPYPEARRDLPGVGLPDGTEIDVAYPEGSTTGYRDYYDEVENVLFAFGHGLSYTEFDHGDVSVEVGGTPDDVTLSLDVENIGARAGADVPQAYLVSRNGEDLRRLVGFERVMLDAGDTATATIETDSRMLGESRNGVWVVDPGTYGFAVGRSATDLGAVGEVTLRGSYTGKGAVEGDVTTGGLIAPGHLPGLDETGTITFEGDLSLDPLAVLSFQLGGTASGMFDTLGVDGDLTLGGAELQISTTDMFELLTGQRFDLIEVGGTLDGTFAGLGEGDSIGGLAADLFITYRAGDGNDIALYTGDRIPAPVPVPASALLLAGAVGGFGVTVRRRRRAI